MKRKLVVPILAVGIVCLLFCVLLEGIATVYLLVRDGGYVPARERLARERNAYLRVVTADKEDCTYLDTLFPHPYLAFVHHGNPPCGIPHINNVGMFGPDYPLEKLSNRFVILVTGGSVAAQFARLDSDGPPPLEEILNHRYLSPKGESFLVLNGGAGAWKYPQQTILTMMYADAIDAVVTIDGFNEHYQLESGLRFEYPANNFHVINPLATKSFRQLMVDWAVADLYRSAIRNPILSRSQAVYIGFRSIRSALKRMDRAQRKKTTIAGIFELDDQWDPEKRRAWQIGQYKKYLRITKRIADEFGLLSAFFIQPVPAISKALTEEEKRIVGDLGYRDLYASMVDELVSLNDQGIPVVSLLDVFADHEGTLYEDPIHLASEGPTGEGRGYRIMADRIADHLEALWGLAHRGRSAALLDR
jgi:hypothetical protein